MRLTSSIDDFETLSENESKFISAVTTHAKSGTELWPLRRERRENNGAVDRRSAQKKLPIRGDVIVGEKVKNSAIVPQVVSTFGLP